MNSTGQNQALMNVKQFSSYPKSKETLPTPEDLQISSIGRLLPVPQWQYLYHRRLQSANKFTQIDQPSLPPAVGWSTQVDRRSRLACASGEDGNDRARHRPLGTTPPFGAEWRCGWSGLECAQSDVGFAVVQTPRSGLSARLVVPVLGLPLLCTAVAYRQPLRVPQDFSLAVDALRKSLPSGLIACWPVRVFSSGTVLVSRTR